MAVSPLRIVNRGLVRYQIREDYEKAFSYNGENKGVPRFVLTPSGRKLLRSPNPLDNWNFSHLPASDRVVVKDYLARLHKFAFNSMSLATSKREVSNRRYARLTTPFGRFVFQKPSSKQPMATEHFVEVSRANDLFHLQITSRAEQEARDLLRREKIKTVKEHWPEPIMRTVLESVGSSSEALLHSSVAQQMEKSHAAISSQAQGFEPALITDAVSLLSQQINYKYSNKVHRKWVDATATTWFNRNLHLHDVDESGAKLTAFASFLHAVTKFSTELAPAQRKKVATILADPEIKTVKDAHLLLNYLKRRRQLLH